MRILHVLRKPLGGLFRHVHDLALEQVSLGHEVGIICDATGCGQDSESRIENLSNKCALGVTRIAISNMPHPNDLRGISAVKSFAINKKIDIIHGHGAKGGLFARIAARSLGLPSAYTPHGGALHYKWTSPAGFAFLSAEKLLRVKKSGLIFVCEFERRLFDQKIGLGTLPNCVAFNGLTPEEFTTAQPNRNATNIVFVGEMRGLKGVDVLLDAIALLRPQKTVTATFVGDGPELEVFIALAEKLSISAQVQFVGRKTMQDAQKLGRILVVPSRNESFPYVILEAIAAQMPVVASNVGGIPEILPSTEICPPGDVKALADAISNKIVHIKASKSTAATLQQDARIKFSVKTMTNEVCILYNRLMTA